MNDPIEEAKTAIAESRYADAAALLAPLINTDNAEADYLYGCLLFSGPDVVTLDNAMDALQRAADLDHPAACYRVATTALDGEGIQTGAVVDPDLLLHAAELGDIDAQRTVGLLHVEGEEGFPEDLEVTRYWYERAAEQGEPLSQHDLGWMMLNGEGGEVDEEAGIRWLAACAMQDDPISERAADFLAVLYEEGRFDVEPNLIEATRWRQRQEALAEAAERASEAEAEAAATAAQAEEDDEEDPDLRTRTARRDGSDGSPGPRST